MGILGGAFNPPHIGHLVCAQEALVQLELDRVMFVPVGEAPHRQIEQDGIPVLEDLRDAIKANDQKAAAAAYKRLQKVETGDATKAAKSLGISGCAD